MSNHKQVKREIIMVKWFYVKEESDGLISWDIYFGNSEVKNRCEPPIIVCESEEGARVLLDSLNSVSCGPDWNHLPHAKWQSKALAERNKQMDAVERPPSTAVGFNALALVTAGTNTAFGSEALKLCTTGPSRAFLPFISSTGDEDE